MIIIIILFVVINKFTIIPNSSCKKETKNKNKNKKKTKKEMWGKKWARNQERKERGVTYRKVNRT